MKGRARTAGRLIVNVADNHSRMLRLKKTSWRTSCFLDRSGQTDVLYFAWIVQQQELRSNDFLFQFPQGFYGTPEVESFFQRFGIVMQFQVAIQNGSLG